MRISKTELLKKPLRVHAFLNDVPLHDVWVFQLKGGEDERELEDFRALFSKVMSSTNLLVKGLFKLRFALGSLFAWDDAKEQIPASSYIHRLRKWIKPGLFMNPAEALLGHFI